MAEVNQLPDATTMASLAISLNSAAILQLPKMLWLDVKVVAT